MRTTSHDCPSCGLELGLKIGNVWMPMSLDEYRDKIVLRHFPRPAASDDICGVCRRCPGDAPVAA